MNMKDSNINSALQIAHTYFKAMAERNVEKIMELAAEDIICTSPIGNLKGTQSFQGFQEGFARMINKLKLEASFGNDEQAVIIYEAETIPVKTSTIVEYINVENGKITSTHVIYDAAPFLEYMASQPKH